MLGLLTGETDQPLAWLQRAVRLNPNSASVALSAGFVHCFAHLPEQAGELFHRAIRLSPLDPDLAQTVAGVALVHLMLDQIDDALTWSKRALRDAPDWAPALRFAIVANVRAGRLDDAHALAEHLLKIDPTYHVEARPRPYGNAAFRAAFKDALRAAGLPG